MRRYETSRALYRKSSVFRRRWWDLPQTARWSPCVLLGLAVMRRAVLACSAGHGLQSGELDGQLREPLVQPLVLREQQAHHLPRHAEIIDALDVDHYRQCSQTRANDKVLMSQPTWGRGGTPDMSARFWILRWRTQGAGRSGSSSIPGDELEEMATLNRANITGGNQES